MNEDRSREFGGQSMTSQVPQVIYSYPFPGGRDDEIDLGGLLANLLAQYKIILGVTLLGTLLSVAIALWLPNIYQKQVILSAPSRADIVSLNSNGYTAYTPSSVFKEHYEELRSAKQFENYVTKSGLLKELFPGDERAETRLIAELQGQFEIEILEPQPEIKGSVVTNPRRLALKLIGKEEKAIASFLNNYAGYIEKLNIDKMVTQQKTQIAAELKNINKKIDLLRASALNARQNEISRKENANQQEISDLNNQIEALLTKSNLDDERELADVDQAYKIAKRLNVSTPTSIANIGKAPDSEPGNKTEINLTDWQNIPLYLMGTEYLDAKREEIKARGANYVFVKEYSSLKQRLQEVKNDAELAALKARKTDDPYIVGMPELIDRKAEIEAMSLDFSGVKLARVEQTADVTGIKVKPKRSLIVIIGCVLSGIISIFLALVVVVIKNRRNV